MTSLAPVGPRWQLPAPRACDAYFARGKAIRALRGITPPAKLLLYELHTWADADGRCFPTWETLAKDTGLGRATVHRLLVELERLGYVAVDHARGRTRPNTYRLTVPAPEPKPSRGETVSPPEKVSSGPEKVSPAPEKVSNPAGKGLPVRPELSNRTNQTELSSARAARDAPTSKVFEDDGAAEVRASVSATGAAEPGELTISPEGHFQAWKRTHARGSALERAKRLAAEEGVRLVPGAAG